MISTPERQGGRASVGDEAAARRTGGTARLWTWTCSPAPMGAVATPIVCPSFRMLSPTLDVYESDLVPGRHRRGGAKRLAAAGRDVARFERLHDNTHIVHALVQDEEQRPRGRTRFATRPAESLHCHPRVAVYLPCDNRSVLPSVVATRARLSNSTIREPIVEVVPDMTERNIRFPDGFESTIGRRQHCFRVATSLASQTSMSARSCRTETTRTERYWQLR